ncbi:MAG: desA [Acidimicrobiales bacterium]|jgi:acyl-[acyl-carrier-protein] desaturase|nr:desA [Acidimicrobiales bacterium]
MPVETLLAELTPVAESLLNRHIASAKEWFPHELVPWSAWAEPPAELDDAVRRAVLVNLLTEDNLPYYFWSIDRLFGGDGVWGEWSRRWTAEEGRHSIVIRDWATVTRVLDPTELERARMKQVMAGFDHPIDGPAEGFVYVALQELATRISHRNTGKLLDRDGYEVMAKVAADENRHYLFYRDLVSAALDIDPSRMMLAIERQVRDFQMPGTGIEGFTTHAHVIARAGIYDLSIHHDQILVPVVLRHWQVESRTGLTPEAERARDKLLSRIRRIERVGRRMARNRDEVAAAG